MRASNLSDIEFTKMIIWILKKLNKNFNRMIKDIETIKENQQK